MKTLLLVSLATQLLFPQMFARDSCYTERAIYDSLYTPERPSDSEILIAFELASQYIYNESRFLYNDLIYRDEIGRLEQQLEQAKQRQKDLYYVENVQTRLALYISYCKRKSGGSE
jgi:hypothetical protein